MIKTNVVLFLKKNKKGRLISSFYVLLKPKASKCLEPNFVLINLFSIFLLHYGYSLQFFPISKKTFMAALFLVIELWIKRQGKSS